MDCEQAWHEWEKYRVPIRRCAQEDALRGLAEYPNRAPPNILIPLFTRYRAMPEILKLVQVYCHSGIAAGEVKAFFLIAPDDSRVAFETVRKAAMNNR